MTIQGINGTVYATVPADVGGEAAIAAMDYDRRMVIGMKTYRFAKRMMRDPEIRAKVKARAAQIREEEAAGIAYCG